MGPERGRDLSGVRTLVLEIAWHGAAFHGWQRQEGCPTVQGELERAWTAVTGERVPIEGASRTDRGVHALGQVAHLRTASPLPLERVRPALNAHLPEAVVVRRAAEAAPGFHARFGARGKRYLYALWNAPVRPVILRGLVAWERRSLDPGRMREAAARLQGRHDFAAFQGAGSPREDTVRHLRAIRIRAHRGRILFLVEGDGFLYRMVRNLVGTLLEVGRGARGPAWVESVLAGRDRRRAGPTAPAEGLYLYRVLYPQDPFRGLPKGYPEGPEPRLPDPLLPAPTPPPRNPG